MSRAILFSAIDVPYISSSLMPDNGLASLAASLLAAGHAVRIRDLGTATTLRELVQPGDRPRLVRLLAAIGEGRFTPEVLAEMRGLDRLVLEGLSAIYRRETEALDDRIRRDRVDFLGLKLWAGAGFRLGMSMAAELKRRNPGLRVFAGGTVASLVPGLVLEEYPAVDALCIGDGEETIMGLAEWCDGRRDPGTIPNLAFRDGASIRFTERRFPDLEGLPTAVYDPVVYPEMAGDDKLPILCLNESRGCPMGCLFCAHARVSGSRWRLLSADRIAGDIRSFHSSTGAWAYRFSGSYTPSKTYREVADRLLASGPEILFSGFLHVNGVRPGDLPVLRRAGLAALFYGIESGSDAMLSGSLGKRTRRDRVARVLNATMDAGIFACGSVIFPAPGETAETERETLSFLLDVFQGRPACAVPVQPGFPQPGSQWFEHMERYGFAADRKPLIAAMADFRVRHLLPMSLWEPLPYTMDGLPMQAAAERTTAMARQLEGAGILTGMGDDSVLVAYAAGIPPAEFRRLERAIFVTADADRMTDVIRAVREGRARERWSLLPAPATEVRS
jgi:hypothetical protein